MSKELLNPQNAFIFRICHKSNVEKVLNDGGCICANDAQNSKYAEIGNQELISKRKAHPVPCGPGGTLGDYVPFYFTPYSPMLYNIKTGYNGIPKKPIEDIVILITSLHYLTQKGVPFVFTDRHAYLKLAQFSNDLSNLSWIIWPVLQVRDFKKDDMDKFEKYQAEALVHKKLPLNALMGIACFNDAVKTEVEQLCDSKGHKLQIVTRRNWFL
ncbi:type II toxin-antitoxin system toxin DNA ADP-ribosyl transferase DarT [Bradyrhizobium manausense]|uniref:DarT domain-containing protein n=1 Tax=Bradyrhizobium manausense TaxID=989370 RepID=A0A0R3E3V1_9BRAD|nr:DUF4433 domain-containing protein [Bradyrhizobium manausense]KRQ16855.1 hypothetical protein AOQ71_04300 [Bradyrhizobium manausense]